MSAWKNIERWLIKLNKRCRIYLLMEKAVSYAAITICIVLLAVILDYLMPIPFVVRKRFIFVLALVPLVLILDVVVGIRKLTLIHIVRLATRNVKSLKDDLVNAYSLGIDEAGIKYYSAQLKEKYFNYVYLKVRDIKEEVIVSLNRLKENLKYLSLSILVAFLLFFTPYPDMKGSAARLFLPELSSEIGQFIKMKTGDFTVPWGGEAMIKLEIIKRPPSKIRLLAKRKKGRWLSLKSELEDDSKLVFRLSNITERWHYRAQLQDLYTQSYTIEPVSMPQIAGQRFHYYYPSYTGKAAEVRENELEISAIKGTRVVMDFVFNKPVSGAVMTSALGWDQVLKKTGDGRYTGEVVLSQDDKMTVNITDLGSLVNPDPAEINVRVDEDRFPTISLLAPDGDIVGSMDAELPVTFEAGDDFGLSFVTLMFKKSGPGKFKKKIIKRYSSFPRVKVDDYSWRYAAGDFSSGDVIEYYLEVFDNDIVSGPKSAATPVYVLEITSFDKEHEIIEEDLKNWRDGLLEILGDEMRAKQAVENMIDSDDGNRRSLEETVKLQEAINQDMEMSGKRLERIIDKMEKDPLGSHQTLQEHRMIARNLDYLRKDPGENAVKGLKSNDLPSALKGQERIVSELEKMGVLSEDLLQYQKMKDMLESANSMNEKADELMRALEGMKDMDDPEKMKQLNDLLSQVNELFAEIAKQLKDMPGELPEEFINQESIKEMDLSSVSQAASSLEKALAEGNISKAIEHAKALLKSISNMLKTMDGAGYQVDQLQEPDELDKDLARMNAEMEQIIIEQTDVLGRTRIIEQRRLKDLYAREESLLKELAFRQEKVIEVTNDVVKAFSGISEFGSLIYQVRNNLNPMNRVLGEFKDLRIVKSQELLEGIIRRCLQMKKSVDRKNLSEKNNKVYGKIVFAHKEEKDILEELKLPKKDMDVKPGKKDISRLKKLSGMQKKLQGRTEKLNTDLQVLSRKTAQLKPELFSNLSGASGEMGEASESMNEADSASAERSSDRALDYLTRGRNELQKAMEAMADMKGQAGMPKPRFFSRSKGIGGVTGAFSGPVPIPGKEDYIPPKEFREEILRSLKERFPEAYKKMVEEYYKRLSE